MAAADGFLGGDAAITQFVATIPSRCSSCNGSVVVTKEAVLRLFDNGADELAAVCPSCKAATCLGCGQTVTATSEKLGKKTSNGIQLTWHCEAARLALTWAYLTGYDARLAATRQSNASASLTRANKRGKYRDDAGVGYSLDSHYDDYPSLTEALDEYIGAPVGVGISGPMIYSPIGPNDSNFAPSWFSHATFPILGQPAPVSYHKAATEASTANKSHNPTNLTSTSSAGASIVRSPSAPPSTSAKAQPHASSASKYHPELSGFINDLPEPSLSESKKPAMPAKELPTSHSDAPSKKPSGLDTQENSQKKKGSKAPSKSPALSEFSSNPSQSLDPFYYTDAPADSPGPALPWSQVFASTDFNATTSYSDGPHSQNEMQQTSHTQEDQYPSLTAKYPYAPPNVHIPLKTGGAQTGVSQLKKLALTAPSLGYSPLDCDGIEGIHSKDYASLPPVNTPLFPAGKPSVNSRKRPSRPQTPERVDPEDAPTAKVLTVLIALLPSRDEQPVATALDQAPPGALTTLLRCSTVFDKVAELLHNGSLEDAAKRSDLYHALLHFVRLLAYGPDRITDILYQPRALDKLGHDLSRASFDGSTRLQFEPNDYGKPLSICMSSLTNQSEMLRKTAAAHPNEFLNEEAQGILAICADIETTAAIVAKRAIDLGAPAKASTDTQNGPYAWQKDVAVMAVPDEDILAQHTYASDARQVVHAAVGRMRRIINEITSLRANLPPNIFVRYGESRPDVLKVVIVGPEGTPYKYGLFEFDVLCPVDYPASPPKMHLRTTGGGRVGFNPNLYPTGYVCLSLLGTWSGEKWQPGKSTMMQIFVSIQAMIFCEEPWCNEPGREGDAGSSRSRRYNRNLHRDVIRYGMLEWIDGKTTQTSPRVKYAFTEHALSEMDLATGTPDTMPRMPAREKPKQSAHGVELFKEVVTKHFETHREQIIRTVNAWVTDHIRHQQAAEEDAARHYPFSDPFDYDEDGYAQLSKKKKPKKSKAGGVHMAQSGAPTLVMTPGVTPATLYAKNMYPEGEAKAFTTTALTPMVTPAVPPAPVYANYKYTEGKAKASTTAAPSFTTKAPTTAPMFAAAKASATTSALPPTLAPATDPSTSPKENTKTNVEMVAADAPLREHLVQALEDYNPRASMRRRGQRGSMEAEPASPPYDSTDFYAAFS